MKKDKRENEKGKGREGGGEDEEKEMKEKKGKEKASLTVNSFRQNLRETTGTERILETRFPEIFICALISLK